MNFSIDEVTIPRKSTYSITVALQSSSKFDDTNWWIPGHIDKHPLNSKKNVACLRPICLFLSHNQYNKKHRLDFFYYKWKYTV